MILSQGCVLAQVTLQVASSCSYAVVHRGILHNQELRFNYCTLRWRMGKSQIVCCLALLLGSVVVVGVLIVVVVVVHVWKESTQTG